MRLLFALRRMNEINQSINQSINLTHSSDFIKKQQDKGHYTGTFVILDIQKAFDIVSHKILLDKLRAIGEGLTKCSELHVTCDGCVHGSESDVRYLGISSDQMI